jgi:hypothetical protein
MLPASGIPTSDQDFADAPFTPQEKRRISGHQLNSGHNLSGAGHTDRPSTVQPLLMWNVGDGLSNDRQAILGDVLSKGFAYPLLLLQECTWKPHNLETIPDTNQHMSGSITGDLASKLGLPNNYFHGFFTKDSAQRWLVTLFDDEDFAAEALIPKFFALRDLLITTLGNRPNVCIGLLRERSSARKFFVVNVHAPRGDMEFCKQVLRLAAALYNLASKGQRLSSGVIWGGDFNQVLTAETFTVPDFVRIVSTDVDPCRPKRPVDFFGSVEGNGADHAKVTLESARLLAWRHDAGEIFDSAVDERVGNATLNHPIMTATIKFVLYDADVEALTAKVAHLDV